MKQNYHMVRIVLYHVEISQRRKMMFVSHGDSYYSGVIQKNRKES